MSKREPRGTQTPPGKLTRKGVQPTRRTKQPRPYRGKPSRYWSDEHHGWLRPGTDPGEAQKEG